MAIKKPAELDFSNKKFMCIISGQPGLGKTTLALSAPKPFLFDTDNGIARVRPEQRGVTSVVESYEEMLGDMDSEEYKAAESVVIDTGGMLVQLMKDWAKKQDSKAAKDGRAMYGVIKSEFDRLCYQIRAKDRKHLIVVFHTTEQQKGDHHPDAPFLRGQREGYCLDACRFWWLYVHDGQQAHDRLYTDRRILCKRLLRCARRDANCRNSSPARSPRS